MAITEFEAGSVSYLIKIKNATAKLALSQVKKDIQQWASETTSEISKTSVAWKRMEDQLARYSDQAKNTSSRIELVNKKIADNTSAMRGLELANKQGTESYTKLQDKAIRLTLELERLRQTKEKLARQTEIVSNRMFLSEKPLTNLQQLSKTATGYLDSFTKAISNTASSIGTGFVTAVSYAWSGLKSYGEMVTDTSRKLLAVSSLLGGLASKSFLGFGDDLQSMKNKMISVSREGENVSDKMSQIVAVANRSKSDLSDVVKVYQKMEMANKEMGLSSDKSLRYTETISKALKIQGATTAEASAATLQLSQAYVSGKLAGDEYRSITEAFPLLQVYLAKTMGVTQSKLKDLSKDGVITSKVLQKAFEEMETDIDKRFAQMPTTIGQALSIAKNQFTIIGYKINETTHIFDKIAISIENSAYKLEKFIQTIINFISALDSNKLKMIAGIFLGSLIPAIAGIVASFTLATIALSPFMFLGYLISQNWDLVVVKLKEAAGKVDNVRNKFSELKNVLKEITDGVILRFKDRISYITTTILPVLYDFIDKVKAKSSDYKVVLENLGTILTNVANIADSLFKVAINLSADAIKILSNIVTSQLFLDALKAITGFFAKYTDIDFYRKAIDDTKKSFDDLLTSVKNFINDGLKEVKNEMSKLDKGLDDFLEKWRIVIDGIIGLIVGRYYLALIDMAKTSSQAFLSILIDATTSFGLILARGTLALLLLGAEFIVLTIKALINFVIMSAGAIVAFATMLLQGTIALVLLGAQFLIMAATAVVAWLIALGPIGLIVAAVVALALIIWQNWESIKNWTIEAFGKVQSFVGGVFDKIGNYITEKINWAINKLNDLLDMINKVTGTNWHINVIKTETTEYKTAGDSNKASYNTPDGKKPSIDNLLTNAPKKARGGKVGANEATWVGDNWDGTLNKTSELWIPDTPGTIYSASDVQNMLKGGNSDGGKGDVFNITNNFGSGIGEVKQSEIKRIITESIDTIEKTRQKFGNKKIVFNG